MESSIFYVDSEGLPSVPASDGKLSAIPAQLHFSSTAFALLRSHQQADGFQKSAN
jgi:hypothetical protein